jgi:hypothetical protein
MSDTLAPSGAQEYPNYLTLCSYNLSTTCDSAVSVSESEVERRSGPKGRRAALSLRNI